ncbi:MAG TPA: hypothetical protein VMM18_01560 [Gemmatimonadaceae bacterium]|nr:hypothetical protein [Gemmatimonadaceae bacterium]
MTAHTPLVRLGVAALAITAALAGCDARASLTSPGTGFATSGPAARTLDRALFGSWRRALVFTDQQGNGFLTETIWEFRGDGSASRTVIFVDFARGVADRVVATANWRVDGSVLEVTWIIPAAGTARFSYGVDARTLRIGNDSFERVD